MFLKQPKLSKNKLKLLAVIFTPTPKNYEWQPSKIVNNSKGRSEDYGLKLMVLGFIFLIVVYSLPFLFSAKTVLAAAFTSECTGGTITRIGGKTIHTFTSSGTLTCTSAGDVDYLVVAGGGGGGGPKFFGAGGGAGGLVYNSSYYLTSGAKTVTVGAGGAGGASSSAGLNGAISVFDSITATGGGGGGGYNGGINGLSGGSGGGSSYGGTIGSGGSQGKNGGLGIQATYYGCGGGGGAGAVGNPGSGTNGGAGGAGLAYSISGSSVYYAGGGGGGGYFSQVAGGAGGSGGGGTAPTLGNGGNGTANTGGGGAGGAGDGGTGYSGGTGGSGVVIVSYTTSLPVPTVTAINPVNGPNTISAGITSITGTYFVSGAAVKLTKSGQTDIACSGFTFTNSTTLSNGSCPITGAAVGAWNVVVTNPDAQIGTLTNGFAVYTPISISSQCSGGTITYSGGNTIHTFTESGIFACPGSGNVKVLAVGGGGGGGESVGGGGGGGGVLYNSSLYVNSIASCKAILDAGSSTGSGLYTIDPDGPGGNAAFQAYCDMTTDGGGWTRLAKFGNAYDVQAATYTNGFGAAVDANYAHPCALFNNLGLASTTTMRINMGQVKDYFKPTDSYSLCQTIIESPSIHFQWSSAHNGTFQTPSYFNNHLGGSAASWPTAIDGRAYLSFWGGNGSASGCCHNTSTIYGGAADGAAWYRAFDMYFKEPGLTAVTVGAGGAGNAGNCDYATGGGAVGSNSSFLSVTAFGGGGGGSYNQTTNGATSGGGGGGIGAGNNATARSGAAGQGYAGGISYANTNDGAGGGGAGQVGGSSVSGAAGIGGNGAANSISGSSVVYGGGGGGGARNPSGTAGGAGGTGGGGAGGYGDGAGTNGTANRGGGGGGGGYYNTGPVCSSGGNGGSGIVIVSYPNPNPAPTVTAINPTSGNNATSTDITSVSGANFFSGAAVKLTKSGQTDIACSGFTFTNSTTLSSGSCPISGALIGYWNVAVTNLDAQTGTLTNGFLVVQVPTITAINPISGINAGPASITSIIGTNFASGAAVKLTKSGQTDIACSGFTFTNSTTLSSGSCPITGAAIGAWNVVVTNPDAQTGTRTNGFTVNNPALGHAESYAYGEQAGWISFDNLGVYPTVYDNHLEGYVYSEQLGWIDLYPYGGGVLNDGLGNLSGTAWGEQAGWIDFAPAGAQPVKINLASNEFEGWAYGEQAGWISFNCLNTASCGAVDYKVSFITTNLAPTVSGMAAPNWNYLQAAVDPLRANLQFEMIDSDSGSYGSAYQVIVKKADDTAVLDTGECTGYLTPSADCKIDNSICLENGATGCVNAGDCVCQYALDSDDLQYNTGYKWWVKIWDETDTASALTAYATTPDTDNNDGVVATFTTYKHKFPKVSATYLPSKPSQGEPVKFTDTSKTFLTAAPAFEVPCDPSKCSWLWTPPAGATIDDAATSTPTIIFNNTGSAVVILKVTDLIDGYYAQATIPVTLSTSLPAWKEVKPE